MFSKLIDKINSNSITFESWFLSALGIIFVRIFLEQYSNNIANHFVLIDPSTIVQYSVSFIAILLWCMAVILYFSKKSIREISLISLFGFIIICTPPIIDLLISKGSGYNIHYIFLNNKDLFLAYITGFWSTASNGMTYGIRIEIIISVLACFGLIYTYTKNISKSIIASIVMYSGIFFVDCIPSFLGLLQGNTIINFIRYGILNSRIVDNSIFSINSYGMNRLFEIGFNSLMIQINIIFIIISILLICLFAYRDKARIILGNARPERILHYSLLVVLGAIFGGIDFFHSWVNILSLFMTVLAFVFAWLSAVCVNDIHDENIDLISNTNRPIPLKLFTKDEFYTLTRIFLILALLCAYGASLYGLFFVILYSFIFYIYSAYPIKLKRHYIGGIITIGIASISSISAGFFLSNPSKELLSLSPTLLLFSALLFGIGSMIKDLKDYDGDKANNIKTLPVVMGLKNSKIIIASLISISLIGASLYIGEKIIITSSIIASIIIWKVLSAKIYKEINFFITYIAFLIICILVFIFK